MDGRTNRWMDGWMDGYCKDWSMFSQPSALFVTSSSISVDNVGSIRRQSFRRSTRHPFPSASSFPPSPLLYSSPSSSIYLFIYSSVDLGESVDEFELVDESQGRSSSIEISNEMKFLHSSRVEWIVWIWTGWNLATEVESNGCLIFEDELQLADGSDCNLTLKRAKFRHRGRTSRRPLKRISLDTPTLESNTNRRPFATANKWLHLT